MTPRKLEDWNLTVITSLLEKGADENEYFDFKRQLPKKSPDMNKTQLAEAQLGTKKDCAAFANSGGGFLVYGVNEKKKNLEEQLEGVPKKSEFPRNFGSTYPKACEPSVDWDFKAIDLPEKEGYAIYVVDIKKGWQRPSGVFHNNVWHFMKRTNSGNESMSYQEIRSMFLDYEEKTKRVDLMLLELESFLMETLVVIHHIKTLNDLPLSTFNLSVFVSLMPDVYSLLGNEALTFEAQALRNSIGGYNNLVSLQSTKIAMHFQTPEQLNMEKIVQSTNSTIETIKQQIISTHQILSSLANKPQKDFATIERLFLDKCKDKFSTKPE